MTKPDEDYGIPRRWITLFFVALTVAFIILAFVIGLKERRDAGLLALCALGSSAVLIISPWVPKPAKLKVSPTGEIEVNLAQQVQQANATAEEAKETASKATQQVQQANATAEEAKETATDALDTITRLVRNSMREETFENLKKIASGKFGHFKMTFNFQQQLRHLQEAGCIATWKGHIAQIPKEGSDLAEYVYCTKPGYEFIQERLDAEARENSPLAS